MNCIYSYWLSKPVLPGAEYGAQCMSAYAKQVGADFRFDRHDPYMNRHGVDARWFDKLRPVFDPTFEQYEKFLVVDSDVFPVDGITANIFDEPVGDFGMVEEPDQPAFRERWPSSLFSRLADEKWELFVSALYRCQIPQDAMKRPRTWNAGVILFSREGRATLRTIAPQPRDYVREAKRRGLPEGYATEQALCNTWAFLPGMNFTPLPLEWNRQIHALGDGSVYDRRTPETKFVHVMLRAADHNDAAWHHRMVNSHKPNGKAD